MARARITAELACPPERVWETAAPQKAWMRPLAGLYLRRQQRQYLADLREALDL